MAETTSRHRKGLKDTCIQCWKTWPCPTALADPDQDHDSDADRPPTTEDT